MIQLKNISKSFISKNVKVDAVKNVDLTIVEGEIFGIIGFSGAGKSTLVRCINLLERKLCLARIRFTNCIARLSSTSNKKSGETLL